MGLPQMALIAGFLALLCAVLGVYLAGSQEDPALVRNADAMGAAMALYLATNEPETWLNDHGSTTLPITGGPSATRTGSPPPRRSTGRPGAACSRAS
ncbi:MAG: hypothetical protein ACYTG3_10860 [Planctomycetota bacterium]